MEIRDGGIDYREIHLFHFTGSNADVPAITIRILQARCSANRMADGQAASIARLKENLVGRSRLSPIYMFRGIHASSRKETVMKLTAIALAAAFAFSGTAALANTVHHKSAVRVQRDAARTVQLHPNYGNPNG